MTESKTPEADNVRKHLIKLFQNTRSEAYMDMHNHVLYRGNDKKRNWSEFANPSVEEDQKYLERLGKRIKRYQDESEGYTFSNYYTEEDKEGFWYVWEVLFKMGPDQRRCYFRFLKVNDQFGLADIDT